MKIYKTWLVIALCGMIVPFANAGTYSIYDVEWYPSNTPGTGANGGYIHFDTNNALDVDYGLSASLDAPQIVYGASGPTNINSLSQTPTMMGNFQWRVRWTGNAGETPPSQGVLCNVEYKAGSALCTTAAQGYGGSSMATSSISDPYFSCGCSSNSGSVGQRNTSSSSPSGTAARNSPQGTGSWTYVAGTVNTYEATILIGVNSGGSLTATGSGYNGSVNSNSQAAANLDVVIRLTFVDGQRVQPDL